MDEPKTDVEYIFINSFYFPEKYEYQRNEKGESVAVKTREDAIIIAYKRGEEQCLQTIRNPAFSFYVAKPEVQITHALDNIPIEKCDLVTIKYHDLNKVLAQYAGRLNEYYELQRGGRMTWEERKNKQKLFKDSIMLNPRIFGSDKNINDYYKFEFVKQYGINIGGYKKGTYDIETNSLSSIEQHNAPINLIGYYDFHTDTMYQLVWDQPTIWDSFKTFKDRVLSGEYEKMLRADPRLNGEYERSQGKTPIKTIENTKIVVEFYEREFDLISRFFQLVHELAPDFMLAWNFTFDLMTMIYRLQDNIDMLGLDVNINDILCDHNVPKEYREYYYKKNNNPRLQFYQKWHIIEIPGKTTWLDAMAMYAEIRKGAGVEQRYDLDSIAQKELKKGKLDYHKFAADPTQLPHYDFTLHAHYHFTDIWLLAEMEEKNSDIDSLMYAGEVTRLQTVTSTIEFLKNYQALFYYRNGLAIGNNVNAIKQPPKKPYKGALVGDPRLNKRIVTPLFKFPSKYIRPFMCDYDLTSMYPMINISHNIYKTTLIFKIDKIGNVNNMRGECGLPGVIDVEEMFDNFQVGDTIQFCHDYLQVPSSDELISGLFDELKNIQQKEKMAKDANLF